VRTYGKHLWLDPGEPDTQKHSLDVIMDAVKRYDLDGVHMDDYFYPYKEKDSAGSNIEFPDEASYRKYQEGVRSVRAGGEEGWSRQSGRPGGPMSRDDWRRNNVDSFIE